MAATKNYALVVKSLSAPTRDDLLDAGDQLYGLGVDGIIIIASAAPGQVRTVEHRWPVPVVVVQGPSWSETPPFCADDRDAAAAAVRHLLALGHRQVWHLAGSAGWWDTAQRINGWRGALIEAGVEPPPVRYGDWTAAAGYHFGTELAADQDGTSVFVANDEMAAGLLAAFRQAGWRCPERVSVIGFDDDEVSGYLDPPLTTVRSDHRYRGRTAVDELVRRLASPDYVVEEPVDIAMPLVIRASTGPPRRI